MKRVKYDTVKIEGTDTVVEIADKQWMNRPYYLGLREQIEGELP